MKCNKVLSLLSAIVLSTTIMASSIIAIMEFDPNKNLVTEAQAAKSDSKWVTTPETNPTTWGNKTFTNMEDADDINDFDGNYRIQNVYKMWSVYREMGMNEYQACAAMGSCACEGLFYSEMIEYGNDKFTLSGDIKDATGKIVKDSNGVLCKKGTEHYTNKIKGTHKDPNTGKDLPEYEYDENGQSIDNWPFTGNHSHYTITDPNKHLGANDSEACRDAYIARWSSKITSDGSYINRCCDDSMRGYASNGKTLSGTAFSTSGIDFEKDYLDKYHSMRNNQIPGVTNNTDTDFYNGSGLRIAGYFYYSPNGVGRVGIGYYGFTGPLVDELFKFAEEHESTWYDADTQLAYLVADASHGGYNKGTYSIDKYIEATKDFDSIQKCEEVWYKTASGGAPMAQSAINARVKSGEALYKMLCSHTKDRHGNLWDRDYGQKILKMSKGEDYGVSSRDGIEDEGIAPYYAEVAMVYPQSCGFLVDTDSNEDMKEANKDVFIGYVNGLTTGTNNSKKYSLYELFGEDIHWYRYTGERTYAPYLLDHIWSAWNQDKLSYLKFKDIWYDNYNYLSCQVYPDRPMVLSKEDLDNGEADPRVLALRNGYFNGFTYVDGTIKMTIAKYFVSIISYLTSDKIFDTVRSMLETIEGSRAWPVVKRFVMIALVFAMCGFIMSLVKKGIQYSKGQGNSSMRNVLGRFLIGMICLALLFACVANPKILNGTIETTAKGITNIFNYALQDSLQEDEVVAVQDKDKVIPAMLWKTALFNAWCRGQFDNKNYNELYTQYASIDKDQSMMEQSHEKVDRSGQEGHPYYDSASLTGDVFVPVGNGVEIRNWAAYLYSCGTKYHIDSTLDKNKAERINTDELYFPSWTLMTTANNASLLADTFRVVDAQMDISPQYFSDGSSVNSYKGAHELKTHFESASIAMLFNAALLLFLVPVIYKKIMSFILLMATLVKLIWFTLMELFKEKEGVPDFFKTLKKHLFDFIESCIKLCILVWLYYKLVDTGFFNTMVYCILCFVVLGWNPKSIKDYAYNASMKIKHYRSHGTFQ